MGKKNKSKQIGARIGVLLAALLTVLLAAVPLTSCGTGASGTEGGSLPSMAMSSRATLNSAEQSSTAESAEPQNGETIDWTKSATFENGADVTPLLEQIELDGKKIQLPFTVEDLGPGYDVLLDKEPLEGVEPEQFGGKLRYNGKNLCDVLTYSYKQPVIHFVSQWVYPFETFDERYSGKLVIGDICVGSTTADVEAKWGRPKRIKNYNDGDFSVLYQNDTVTLTCMGNYSDGPPYTINDVSIEIIQLHEEGNRQ